MGRRGSEDRGHCRRSRSKAAHANLRDLQIEDLRVENPPGMQACIEASGTVEGVEDAWVDPEVIVWMHNKGEITAQVMLSPPE